MGLAPLVTFAPVDFERETLADGLARGGFDAARPAFFSWLGVTPYLTRDAVLGTLAYIAGVRGAEVVFDHGEPVSSYPPEQQARAAARGDGAAALGEPWITFFTPAEIAAELTVLGFAEIEGLQPRRSRRTLLRRPRHDRPGGHVVRARR